MLKQILYNNNNNNNNLRVAAVVATLWAGRLRKSVATPDRDRRFFSLLKKFQAITGAYQAPSTLGTAASLLGVDWPWPGSDDYALPPPPAGFMDD